ncbi:S4 domain-containing protein, partial [Thomasclavelia cocleata]
MRLDKLLSNYGIGTRKEVKAYIRKGFVEVNGKVIKKDDTKVDYQKDIIIF